MNPTRVVGRRCIAYILDGLIVSIVAGTILWFFDHDWYRVQAEAQSASTVTLDPAEQTAYSGLLLLFWIVEVMILEGMLGWTPGKLIMQLRVVKPDGTPPGPFRAFVRYVLWIVDWFPYCVPAVGLGLALSTDSHRRVGDMVANTYVIDAIYFGRVILHTGTGVEAGPERVRPEDLGLTSVELDQITRMRRTKEPTFDRNLDTYVVWNDKQQRMLRFDKASKTWVPLEHPNAPQI
jgi:uncharacterized RDD family membrane protein YckC